MKLAVLNPADTSMQMTSRLSLLPALDFGFAVVQHTDTSLEMKPAVRVYSPLKFWFDRAVGRKYFASGAGGRGFEAHQKPKGFCSSVVERLRYSFRLLPVLMNKVLPWCRLQLLRLKISLRGYRVGFDAHTQEEILARSAAAFSRYQFDRGV